MNGQDIEILALEPIRLHALIQPTLTTRRHQDRIAIAQGSTDRLSTVTLPVLMALNERLARVAVRVNANHSFVLGFKGKDVVRGVFPLLAQGGVGVGNDVAEAVVDGSERGLFLVVAREAPVLVVHIPSPM